MNPSIDLEIKYKEYIAEFIESTRYDNKERIKDLLEEKLNIIQQSCVLILSKKDEKLITIDNVYKIKKKGLKILFYYHCPEISTKTQFKDLMYVRENKYEPRKEEDLSRHSWFKNKDIRLWKDVFFDDTNNLIVGLDYYQNSIRNIDRIFLYNNNFNEEHNNSNIIFKNEDTVYLKNPFEIKNIKKNLEFPFPEHNPYNVLYEIKYNWFKD